MNTVTEYGTKVNNNSSLLTKNGNAPFLDDRDAILAQMDAEFEASERQREADLNSISWDKVFAIRKDERFWNLVAAACNLSRCKSGKWQELPFQRGWLKTWERRIKAVNWVERDKNLAIIETKISSLIGKGCNKRELDNLLNEQNNIHLQYEADKEYSVFRVNNKDVIKKLSSISDFVINVTDEDCCKIPIIIEGDESSPVVVKQAFMPNQLPDRIEQFVLNSSLKEIEKAIALDDEFEGVEIIETDVSSYAKKIDDNGVVKQLADAICVNYNFARDSGGSLYIYQNSVYVAGGERFVYAKVKELLEDWGLTKKWSSHRSSEVAAYISADALPLLERPLLNVINVLNGLICVNLETGSVRLEPHTYQHLSTIQLPIFYDENARADVWHEFVKKTFPHDAKELAWQLAAWLMIPHTSIQKAVLLVGEGSNGKSIFLNALKAFLSSRNVSSMTLQRLENERFSTAHLYGKLANICPDLPSTRLTSSSTFKSIVGGDAIVAEHKGKEQFEFTPFARLIFSSNHLPQSDDASFAFFRRFLVVPFTQTIDDTERIPSEILNAKLAEPRQLSGVLNEAIKALPKLIKNGLIESVLMKEASTEFRKLTDPLTTWIEQNCVFKSKCIVPKDELLKAYNNDCRKHKRPEITMNALTASLKRSHLQIKEAQHRIAGKKPRCFVGVGLEI